MQSWLCLLYSAFNSLSIVSSNQEYNGGREKTHKTFNVASSISIFNKDIKGPSEEILLECAFLGQYYNEVLVYFTCNEPIPSTGQ